MRQLHPFAVTVLGGLVTSTVVVLLLVPMFLLAIENRSARTPAPASAANHDTDAQA